MQPVLRFAEVATPNLFKDFRNRIYAIEVHGQEIKDLGFVLRQLQYLAVTFDHMGLSVKHIPPDRYPPLDRRSSLLPAVLTIDMRVDPGHETGNRRALRNVIIRSSAKR